MKELGWRAVLAGDGPVEDYRRQATLWHFQILLWKCRAGLTPVRRGPCVRVRIYLSCLRMPKAWQWRLSRDLSHGLAVVTTRVGAHEEVIYRRRNRHFRPVGDQDAFAAALAKLVIRSRHSHPPLGPGAAPIYLNHFSMRAYMRSTGRNYTKPFPRNLKQWLARDDNFHCSPDCNSPLSSMRYDLAFRRRPNRTTLIWHPACVSSGEGSS